MLSKFNKEISDLQAPLKYAQSRIMNKFNTSLYCITTFKPGFGIWALATLRPQHFLVLNVRNNKDKFKNSPTFSKNLHMANQIFTSSDFALRSAAWSEAVSCKI